MKTQTICRGKEEKKERRKEKEQYIRRKRLEKVEYTSSM